MNASLDAQRAVMMLLNTLCWFDVHIHLKSSQVKIGVFSATYSIR